MSVPYADITDLLGLDATAFECVEGASPEYAVEGGEAIFQGDGTFLQEDASAEKINYTHKYHVKDKTAALPQRGAYTNGTDVYWIDNVKVDKPERGHWSMTVTFHRWADLPTAAKSMSRTDLGL